MDAYEQFIANEVPVIWLPWAPSSYVGTGYPEHAKNVHGTVSTFNQVTDLYYPNWWTVSQQIGFVQDGLSRTVAVLSEFGLGFPSTKKTASGCTQTLFFPVGPEVASARYCAGSFMNKSRVNVIVFANPPSLTVNV